MLSGDGDEPLGIYGRQDKRGCHGGGLRQAKGATLVAASRDHHGVMSWILDVPPD